MSLKSGNNSQLMANSRTPVELKNCKLENPSLLFGPLAQYLGRDKRQALSPCVTFVENLTALWHGKLPALVK